jgi:23S rRNA (adenine2503-C2)-methyltransferase
MQTVVRLLREYPSRLNRRFVAELGDGARIECALYLDHKLCVSSQVGCAVGCPFCASGARGLSRPLTFLELTGQLEAVEAQGHCVTHVTVSGVGEPLHNHQAVWDFVGYCRARGIKPSLTTSGGPLQRLRQWLTHNHNGLTISVHAGTEATRARLVPRGPALEPLFATLRDVVPTLTGHRRKKTALAYLLVAGENDGDAEVDAFLGLSLPIGLAVHLYAYNPVSTSDHQRTEDARYRAVYARMVATGLRVRMSSQARIEGNGGCGTLLAMPVKVISRHA